MRKGVRVATKTKQAIEPELIRLADVAKRAALDPKTICRRIEEGTFAMPIIREARTIMFRKDTIDTYLLTGEWPKNAKFKPGAGRGREA